MTIGELVRARDRAAGMFSNFGDEESASEFGSMTPEAYASRQGIEVIENPIKRNRRKRIMAQKSQRVEELEGAIEDCHTDATGEYTTKAEMQNALDRIADACVDVVPDLDDSETENDDSETENDNEPGDDE